MKKELCVKLVIYKDYTEMHGQQNIKFLTFPQVCKNPTLAVHYNIIGLQI